MKFNLKYSIKQSESRKKTLGIIKYEIAQNTGLVIKLNNVNKTRDYIRNS